MKKLEEAGVFTNIERPVHHRFARSVENIAIVSESVAEDPNVSTSRRSLELGLSHGTIWRILHLDPYIRKKSSSRNNRRQLTIHNIVDTWNGCLNYKRWTAIFRKKFSSALKYISHSVGMLINKIVLFGFLRILK